MANARIGWEKPLDSALLTASASVAGLGVTRLKTRDVVDAFNAGANSVTLTADFGTSTALDGTALIGTNLTASATRRIRVSTSDPTAGDVFDSGSVAAGVDPDFSMLVAPFSSTLSGRYLRIDLADASLSEITAGRWWAGELFQPGINVQFGWRRLFDETTQRSETPGRQTHALRRAQRRGFQLSFGFLTAVESESFAETMQREVGLWDDALFILTPDSNNLGRDSLWGELADLADVSNPFFGWFSFRMTIVERK